MVITDRTSEQLRIVEQARSFLETEFPATFVRRAWDGTADLQKAWSAIADVGFLGSAVSEDFGGLGLGLVETALLLEEAGRVALPGPLLETLLAGWVVMRSATQGQKERWVPQVVGGSLLTTIAVESQPYVAYAQEADLIVWCRENETHILPRGSFSTTAVRSNDHSRVLAQVTPMLSPATRISDDPSVAQQAVDGAAVCAAAFLDGLSSHLLDASLTYAKERSQFDRPIGSFQAIQHKLAESHVALEFARPTTMIAANLLDAGDPDASTASSVAKVCASKAAAEVNDNALQCHGGIGFTWEHDLQLWLKRGKAMEHAYGSARWHRARLAKTLFGSGALT